MIPSVCEQCECSECFQAKIKRFSEINGTHERSEFVEFTISKAVVTAI
jgi:hypothetical protein